MSVFLIKGVNEMKKKPFLMEYFGSIVTPSNIFNGRNYLSWPKILFIFIFSISCFILPITIQMAKMTSFPIEYLSPNMASLPDDAFVEVLSQYHLEEGILTGDKVGYSEVDGDNLLAVDFEDIYTVTGDNQKYQVEGFSNAILFTENELIITESTGYGFRIDYRYADDSDFSISSKEDLLQYISHIWYTQNKVYIFPMMILAIVLVVATLSILQLFGMACILWLTKKSNITRINSYKESVNVVLNAAGIPTILAVLYGFMQFNIMIMFLIQSFGAVIFITLTFFKTKFR